MNNSQRSASRGSKTLASASSSTSQNTNKQFYSQPNLNVNKAIKNCSQNPQIQQARGTTNTPGLSYSAIVAGQTVTNTHLTNNNLVTLVTTRFHSWTKQQVCSLLSSEMKSGGAGLAIEDVKPLYDAGFKGTALNNIVANIQNKDIYFAMDRTTKNKDYKNVSQSTLESVVNWVENLLKTRFYHLYTIDELVVKSVKDGVAGLNKIDLCDARLDNYSFDNLDELVEYLPTSNIQPKTVNAILCWIDKVSKMNLDITVPLVNFDFDLDLQHILQLAPNSFQNSISAWNENIETSIQKQKSLLQQYYKTGILPNHFKHFNTNDYNLYSFVWDTFSIPKDKVKQLQEAIDNSKSIGRGISDKTVIAFTDLSGMGKTHSIFNLASCKPTIANKYLIVFTTKDSKIIEKFGNASIDSQVCASIFAYSSLLLIKTLLEDPTTTNMKGLDFLRYLRDGGDEICCRIYDHICKTNPRTHKSECEDLLILLERKYNVKIVFVFDEACQLIPLRVNTVHLTSDKTIPTGSMLHAVYKQFLFVNTVYIDTSLSITDLLDKISGEGRQSLHSVFGTIKPWYFAEVSSMLLHIFNLPSKDNRYLGSFNREFWLLCYLLIGVPEKTVTFYRMVLHYLQQNPQLKITEKTLFTIFFKCISSMTKTRITKSNDRFITFDTKKFRIPSAKLKDLLLSLILNLPVTLSSSKLSSLDPKSGISDEVKGKLSLVDRSIVPVEQQKQDYHFQIIDPIDYFAYTAASFKHPKEIWEKLVTIRDDGKVFEFMMILLLMHESERLQGESVLKSPLFSDLKDFERYANYQLNVKGFIKDKSLNKNNLKENNNITGVWYCQLYNLITDAFVIPDILVRPDGLFFLKEANSDNTIPVVCAFSLVENVENDEIQPHKALNMFMTTGLENFAKTRTGENNDIIKPIAMPKLDRYLRWMVCPKMEFVTQTPLEYLKTNISKLNHINTNEEILSSLNDCDLLVMEKSNRRILDCIEQYSKKSYYTIMKKVYSNLFSQPKSSKTKK